GFCGTVIWKVTTLLAFPPDPVGAAACESLMATPQPNVGRCLPQRWSFGNFFLPEPEPVPPHILACRSPRVVRPERVNPESVPSYAFIHSAASRKAAPAASGQSGSAAASSAASSSKCGRGVRAPADASTAATPKISTGVASGKTSS